MKKNIIFISGTGRSGTNLLGRIISSHNNIEGRIEENDTFSLITSIATMQDYELRLKTVIRKHLLYSKLKKIIKNSDKNILEKSHPSLWLVDFLIKKFDNARFVFVYRESEPTVNSMLEHKGVLSWYNKLPLTKPNRFLGITDENKQKFPSYSIEEKCALRWKSHYNEIFRLKKKYPSRIFLIKYDDFLKEHESTITKLSEFLNISNNFEIEDFNTESLDKWKNNLSNNQIKKINKIIKS